MGDNDTGQTESIEDQLRSGKVIALSMGDIIAGKSEKGGFNLAQLRILRVTNTWPPPEDWEKATVGRILSRESYERFIAMAGQSKGQKGGFATPYDPDRQQSFA